MPHTLEPLARLPEIFSDAVLGAFFCPPKVRRERSESPIRPPPESDRPAPRQSEPLLQWARSSYTLQNEYLRYGPRRINHALAELNMRVDQIFKLAKQRAEGQEEFAAVRNELVAAQKEFATIKKMMLSLDKKLESKQDKTAKKKYRHLLRFLGTTRK